MLDISHDDEPFCSSGAFHGPNTGRRPFSDFSMVDSMGRARGPAQHQVVTEVSYIHPTPVCSELLTNILSLGPPAAAQGGNAVAQVLDSKQDYWEAGFARSLRSLCRNRLPKLNGRGSVTRGIC